MQNLPESKLPSNLKWICEKCLEGKGDVAGCAWRVIDGELCPEFSNLIRDLEKKKDPWIPVKAGTPKPYKNVHIYCANSGIEDVGYYSKYSGKWNLSNGRIAYGVTHWKYLDNTPEVDKDES